MFAKLVSVALLLSAAAGCGKSKKSAASSKPDSDSGVIPTMQPAKDSPRNWTMDEIEQTCRDNMKFTELSLTSSGLDKMTGRGKKDGVEYTITVRYRPGEIRIDAFTPLPGGSDRPSYHWTAEGQTPQYQ